MLVLLILLYIIPTIIVSAVLDPALYLLPSPPLISSEDPGLRWAQPTRVTRDADIADTRRNDVLDTTSTSTEDSESMESSETFWAGLRPSSYGLGGIHIPLTFSVSGTYGKGGYGTGVVGSSYGSGLYGSGVATSYGSLSAGPTGNYGKSALAGSGYGTYGSGYPGVRLFGSSDRTGWSGWGNGKWGHYGKG